MDDGAFVLVLGDEVLNVCKVKAHCDLMSTLVFGIAFLTYGNCMILHIILVFPAFDTVFCRELVECLKIRFIIVRIYTQI